MANEIRVPFVLVTHEDVLGNSLEGFRVVNVNVAASYLPRRTVGRNCG